MDQNRTHFWDEMSPMAARQAPQAQYRNRVREPSEERSSYQCCEGNFNFSTAQSEEDDFYHKKKMSRDPMSHRIIEKRRRDRMNNCLADLSRLIPAEYLKKGRGRVEKTEIIEMAIKHLQHLQQTAYNQNQVAFPPTAPPSESPSSVDACGSNMATNCTPNGPSSATTNGSTVGSTNGVNNGSSTCNNGGTSGSTISISNSGGSTNNGWEGETSEVSPSSAEALPSAQSTSVRPIVTEHYRLGYQECVSEAMHFLVEVEGFFACDALCVRLINHLQRHCDRIVKGDRLNFPRSRKPGETSSSSGSSTSGVCSSNICASSVAPSTPEIGDFTESPLPAPAHSYKFKNTIKQRFSDDQEERRHKRRRAKSASPSPSGSRSPSPSIKCSPSPRLETLPAARSETSAVPIFVLHSKGSFYVPLTVAYDVLAPYLDRLDSSGETFLETGQSSPRAVTPSRPASVLHPVTISVNFPQCPTQRVTPSPGQLALPLQPHSPGNFGSPPTCCPMPAWGPYGGNG